MAKREKKDYTCTAVYTEGCSQRLTEALVKIYRQREREKRFKGGTDEDETA